MARIPRVLYRLFGVDGPTADFGTFGSKAAGAPVYTKDVAVIQSLDAWANGWKNALQSGERQPFLEDWNAKDHVHGYMLAYLMQEGVPEWNGNTEYHQNSIVKKPGTFELYASLVNNNTGNTLPTQTDDVNWKFLFPVRTSQLLGTITNAQIDAIASSKITGTVADAQIASMAASKITGTVADAQIASMAASKITGPILSAQIDSLATSKLTGGVGTSLLNENAATLPGNASTSPSYFIPSSPVTLQTVPLNLYGGLPVFISGMVTLVLTTPTGSTGGAVIGIYRDGTLIASTQLSVTAQYTSLIPVPIVFTDPAPTAGSKTYTLRWGEVGSGSKVIYNSTFSAVELRR
jgi:hypothetical protein